MSTEEKIQKLMVVLHSRGVQIPPNFRLFMISPKSWIRAYPGHVESMRMGSEYNFLKRLRLDRGAILDAFAKLEFLINELIRVQLDPDGVRAEKIDDMLEGVDLYGRVKMLNDWGVIDSKLRERLQSLKQVRNGLAHKWDKQEVSYKGAPLGTNFESFKSDLVEAWKELVSHYEQEQSKIDIDKLIAQLSGSR